MYKRMFKDNDKLLVSKNQTDNTTQSTESLNDQNNNNVKPNGSTKTNKGMDLNSQTKEFIATKLK